MKISPVKREKSPKRISADSIEKSCCVTIFIWNLVSPIIRKLNREIPFSFFDHCNRRLKIISTLTGHSKFIALNLRFDGLRSFISQQFRYLLGILSRDALLEWAIDFVNFSTQSWLTWIDMFNETPRFTNLSFKTSNVAFARSPCQPR